MLDGATRDVDAPEHVGVATRRRDGRRVGVLVGAAVVVVVALIAGLLALTGGSGDDRVHVEGAGRTVVQLVGYGDGTDYEDLVFADPETGTTRRVGITGSCFCQLVVVNGTIWGDDDRGVFRLDPPYEELVRVNAERGTLFPTLDGTGVWVGSGRVGAVSVRKINATTNDVGPKIALLVGIVAHRPPGERGRRRDPHLRRRVSAASVDLEPRHRRRARARRGRRQPRRQLHREGRGTPLR